MKNFFNFFKKSPKEANLKEALKERYGVFQNLLSENNNVLGLMADMEEKHSGETVFDKHYIGTTSRLIAEKVSGIIKNLNVLSEGKYKTLNSAYDEINKKIEKVLSSKFEIPPSDLTIPINNLTSSMSNIAGGKIAHLGQIKKDLNVLVPEGFVITAYAFKKFLEHNELTEKITETLSSLRVENLEELNNVSQVIQQSIIKAWLPLELEDDIQRAYSALCKETGSDVPVSVRSSAVREDGEFSFAGQYATLLNVRGDSIVRAYKEVVASLFNPRAIFYYKTKGFSEEELVMAVGVLKMIDAMSAGVIYTQDPNDPDRGIVIINALWGLGKSVVDGSIDPDSYIVEKSTGVCLEKNIEKKHKMLICDDEADTKEIPIPPGLENIQCLTDEQMMILYHCATVLENYYGKPQDIEWAVDHDSQIYILQTRPLRILNSQSPGTEIPQKVKGYPLLLNRGVIACKGIGYGRAFVLKNEKELKDFPDGAVLVAKHTNTKFVTVMNKASAIITDIGGTTGHMASLSREYQVPTILDTEAATGLIKNGQEITVDAIHCNIYEGKVNELLEYAENKKEPFKGTQLFSTLDKVLKWISPLSLIDPDKENFKPEQCSTFHDITRFAHEMAMAEIFQTGKGFEIDSLEDFMSAIAFAEAGETKDIELQAIILKLGIPVDARLIDIEGGVRGKIKRSKAAPDDIISVPFSAFLKGLTSMRWPGPTPGGPQGFVGSAAQISSLSKKQFLKTQEKSYAIISANHMNFSIRLGFHFSMIEAYAGDNINDNYIKFFFKGGGAAQDRKLRRVRLITEIIKAMDFKVKVTEDVMSAVVTKYKQSSIEEKLEVLGKLTAYTKQLDMAMFNDAVTDMFIEDFIREHIKLSQ